MGKLLQVRVSASTIDPGKVEKIWPNLSRLAYPAGNDYAPAKRGVLEIIETLRARMVVGEVAKPVAALIEPSLAKAEGLVARFEEALGSWDVNTARALSEKIEDALDEVEDRAS